ncbi:hypothetical protein [Candidatus Chlorohelix sp.]|uniref:hypothetical protein n=1 Tax=Candidatus Chlorohelix sp. TaxID=3139201 RepID=UPI003051A9B6
MEETYTLVSEAERKLVITSNTDERAILRQKISDYERFLSKWQQELDNLLRLKSEEQTGEEIQEDESDKNFGAAYFYELARKAFSQGFFPQAKALAQIVREQEPYYPGLEAFEHALHNAFDSSELNWDESLPKEPSHQPTKISWVDRPRTWVLAVGAVILILIVATITILLTNPANQVGSGNKANVTTVSLFPTLNVIVQPPATEAPFLVPTPTVPIQPTVPPGLDDNITPNIKPTSTPLPSPTKR